MEEMTAEQAIEATEALVSANFEVIDENDVEVIFDRGHDEFRIRPDGGQWVIEDSEGWQVGAGPSAEAAISDMEQQGN